VTAGGARVLHATGLRLAGHGVLITGPSGSGKSLLALDLLDQFSLRGQEALLVADDGVAIAVEADGLTMAAPKSIAGLIELRGRGIVPMAHADKARVDLVVDLMETPDRMPEGAEFATVIAGVAVARCPVPRRGETDPIHQRLLVLAALRALGWPG